LPTALQLVDLGRQSRRVHVTVALHERAQRGDHRPGSRVERRHADVCGRRVESQVDCRGGVGETEVARAERVREQDADSMLGGRRREVPAAGTDRALDLVGGREPAEELLEVVYERVFDQRHVTELVRGERQRPDRPLGEADADGRGDAVAQRLLGRGHGDERPAGGEAVARRVGDQRVGDDPDLLVLVIRTVVTERQPAEELEATAEERATRLLKLGEACPRLAELLVRAVQVATDFNEGLPAVLELHLDRAVDALRQLLRDLELAQEVARERDAGLDALEVALQRVEMRGKQGIAHARSHPLASSASIDRRRAASPRSRDR
jgi:hypothetical protein